MLENTRDKRPQLEHIIALLQTLPVVNITIKGQERGYFGGNNSLKYRPLQSKGRTLTSVRI